MPTEWHRTQKKRVRERKKSNNAFKYYEIERDLKVNVYSKGNQERQTASETHIYRQPLQHQQIMRKKRMSTKTNLNTMRNDKPYIK